MEIVIILITSIILICILAILVKFNLKDLKLIKKIGEDTYLNELTNKLPENEEICKDILKILNNEDVNIKAANENTQASLYVIATNTILIANIKNTFTRVQTIAHECLHSVQDKTLLWFNFIFSNIYIVYFITISILSLINKLPNQNIFAIILIMMSFLLYYVRSFLEIDAMTKAKYLAKEYMESKYDLISKNDIEIIVKNYEKINSLGIKNVNFSLILKNLVKVIIFCVVSLI